MQRNASTWRVIAAISTLGIAVGLSIAGAAPAQADVGVGTCVPTATVSPGVTKVARGSAQCTIPSGKKVTVTVILFLGGVEWNSSYKSCTTTATNQTCTGTPVSRKSPSPACSRVLISWQDFYGTHYARTQTGSSCP